MERTEAGILEAIWIKRAHRGPMDPATRAVLEPGAGILGNADRGGKRQVTIIDADTWDGVQQGLGTRVDPAARRANLMVRGLRLAETRGQVLRVGTCRIRIHGETRPCERMDEAHEGLRAALAPNWGGGVYGEVLDAAAIAVGDKVSWETA